LRRAWLLPFSVSFFAALASALLRFFGFLFIGTNRVVIIFVEFKKGFWSAFDFPRGEFAIFVLIEKGREGIGRRRTSGTTWALGGKHEWESRDYGYDELGLFHDSANVSE
jgi:hypothetical protein